MNKSPENLTPLLRWATVSAAIFVVVAMLMRSRAESPVRVVDLSRYDKSAQSWQSDSAPTSLGQLADSNGFKNSPAQPKRQKNDWNQRQAEQRNESAPAQPGMAQPIPTSAPATTQLGPAIPHKSNNPAFETPQQPQAHLTTQHLPPTQPASSPNTTQTIPVQTKSPSNPNGPYATTDSPSFATPSGFTTPITSQQRQNLQPYREPDNQSSDPFEDSIQLEMPTELNGNTNQPTLAAPFNPSASPGTDTPSQPMSVVENQNQFGMPTQNDPIENLSAQTPTDDELYSSIRKIGSRTGKVPAKLASATIGPKEPAPEPKPKSPKDSENAPSILAGAKNYVLAAQPKKGDHWKDDRPITDRSAFLMPTSQSDFSPTPTMPELPYDPYDQMQIYEGKQLNSNQRPIIELGRPWYQLGQLSPGYSFLGKHNNITPQFLVYGDIRGAIASNTNNGDNVSQIAFEVNLDFDLKITSTERIHWFMSPVDDGRNTRYLLDDDVFVEEFDADFDFGYLEGDLGAIVGGFTNETLPFDMPFAVGVMPLLFQNGVWFEDAFLGWAMTIPARNSPKFNISNMDVTFFGGYDKISSDAFPGDDSAARMYGMATFIEAMNGYFEIDYAFLDDRTVQDRSYHNFGFGFTRRYGRFVSNSTRIIVNAGQSTDVVENTADGVLLLSENSLITGSPSTLVPYFNLFAGFDRPQSAARAAAAGGVLRNTGILFESDGMTGYPTLDPTANDTFGGAFGINLIADDFSQQLVVEAAALGVMGDDANRNAPGAQYGLGMRYQLPLSNAVILRMDGMIGFLDNAEDIRGLRMELRHKY